MAIDTLTCHLAITTRTNGGTSPARICYFAIIALTVFSFRNVGILLSFLVFFFIAYLISAEFAKPPKSKSEVLIFRRGKMPSKTAKSDSTDVEAQPRHRPVLAEKTVGNTVQASLTTSTSVFHWEDLCYDIKIKGSERRILDHVDGWVKPGASTALMVSLSVTRRAEPY